MSEDFNFGGEIVWRPNEDYVKNARLTAFMQARGIVDFNELMRR
jgi:hypothetical protein